MPQSVTGKLMPDAQAILEAGPGSVMVLSLADYSISYCNKQFEFVFGYSEGEVVSSGVNFRQIMGEEQIERLLTQVELVRESREALTKYYVYTLTNKQGQERSFYLYLAPLPGDGNLFHVLIIPDYSTRSFPFNSFDSRDLFLQQLAAEKHGSFEWMSTTQKVFWTDGMYDIYEIEKGRYIDRAAASLFTHPDDASKGAGFLQAALDSRGVEEMEMRIITGKGNTRTVRILGKYVFNDSNEPVKFVGSVKDITAQKMIEEELKQNVEELNRSNKELEEFAYVASHDLQEPLRKISTFSDRLSDKYKDTLTGEGEMYLGRIMASAENMRTLINNLLDFSRVNRDQHPFEPVDIDFVLKQVKNELELKIEETGTLIESVKLPRINGSLPQLTQVFANIISNAIKFRKEDVKPHIQITTGPLNEEDWKRYKLENGVNYCKIIVADNGIGFEEEYAQKIFQVFQRLHGKSEYPGSGIGLAICKRIVERHGGFISAEGEEGVGSKFIIILPVLQ